MALKTNFKDDVFTGNRKYNQINNTDETVSFVDATQYTQEGDSWDALTINQINNYINQLHNENLLVNADFTKPINSQGAVSYTANTTDYIFTIDNWHLSKSNGSSLKVNADSVTLSVTKDGYVNSLVQDINGGIDLAEQYTLSVKLKGDDKVYSATNDAGSDLEKEIKTNVQLRIVHDTSENVYRVAITQSGIGEISLEWCKLEKGTEFTGYTPRSLTTESALCNELPCTWRKVNIAVSSITSTTTYTKYPFAATLKAANLTGLQCTEMDKPFGDIQPNNAYVGGYMLATGINTVYVYFESKPTQAVVFDNITLMKAKKVGA